jgi:hypothetical protein
VILAAVFLVADLIARNVHYEQCMALEQGSWSWWAWGCFIYDSAPTALAVTAGVSLAAYVGIQLWARRSA